MTSQSSERPPWQEWASEQLGVSAEASAADAGIAFLGYWNRAILLPQTS